MREHGSEHSSEYLKRLLATLLIVGLLLLAWRIRYVLLLAFGSVLLAVVIRVVTQGFCKWLKLPPGLAFPLVVILMIATPILTLTKFGADIVGQADLISDALPAALEQARSLLAEAGFSDLANKQVGELASESTFYDVAAGALMSLGDALINLVIVVVGGVFLASSPEVYRRGFIKLLPPTSRDAADLSLREIGRALALWLKGRLLAMLLVGLFSGLGLWLIGVPSYLTLALLAGLLEFVPFIGPVIAAIPAVLLALLIGPTEAMFVIGLYFLVQQFEGNLMTPLIQQHAVDLPPALLIYAVLGFGFLFGLAGVILAAPLTVVLFVLVKRLYVREYLNTSTPIPGSTE
ncbi:AI-2E family transporter [Erythrobacter sp. NFXS35]|uniref:AI-2E family transporter n=1 Tax=Erythrobacter sp. NFXS35 TaxID=2818436 RepID=UPI0032DE871D